MIKRYFRGLYKRTMSEAYATAHREIRTALTQPGRCLDCGASSGGVYHQLARELSLDAERYCGIEWNTAAVAKASQQGINIVEGDLNKKLPFDDGHFQCVFGLSVLEHLLYPCHYLRECHRVLETDGTLVILTPNISTLFTIALLLVGKMPSSGPYPDSNELLAQQEILPAHNPVQRPDTQSDTPSHRHLVVFSYRVLKSYLNMLGFSSIKGYGYGLYPFPNFMQPVLERIDPYHCHQMVFVARK